MRENAAEACGVPEIPSVLAGTSETMLAEFRKKANDHSSRIRQSVGLHATREKLRVRFS